ncbi:phage prohead protease, HK97 family [Prevotella dentalis DSM 3688]|uniref:HK97 family phage prohead protease n=1 Tax=Prevotella dentalis (strain ATCC 49559 / DSM 3688 / JCM 13448 / NCTC 12043 / ES 2772) TaxID=908937 RepID=F9D302_PREDD|nr:HK97 family phage prohead protease [Prevotella dentalis]AGB28674.1 phage prohead protease, HK97 family [Prevotella dentalis DSM 3688]EGQ15469.1 HK97 family phage prohead protease [Prevotella dentalis DSM 3688]
MKEIRNNNFEPMIAPTTERSVEGYALVFDSESNDLGGFVETIDKNALDGVLEKSDVLCLLNHNEERGVLARWRKKQGSLALYVDEKGLKYSFDAPNTALGDELLEGLKRGDIDSSSFAFAIGEDKWEKRNDGTYLRRILKFKEIYDVSPVYHPAYSATSVNTRGLEELKEKELNKSKLLDIYYQELKDKLNG